MKILFFITISILLFHSCKPDCEIAYDFEFPASIQPTNDTLNVDDTLWLEFNFSDVTREYSMNEDVDLGSDVVNWGKDIHLYFYKFTDSSLYEGSQGEGVFSFEFLNEIGGVNIQNDVITSVSFEYYNNSYHLKSGLIPKETGIYFISFGFRNPNIHNHGYEININHKENCVEYINTLKLNVNEQVDGLNNTNSHILSDNSASTPHNSIRTYSFVVQ